MSTPTQTEFVLTRVLDAPRELVFRIWTEAEHLVRWFGPKGMPLSQCTNDLRPGGVMHYEMRAANGASMWGKWVYREIAPPERLTFVTSFSDEAGGTTRAPFAETWPLEMLSIVTFEEHDGQTLLTLRSSAVNATDEERATFEAGFESMTKGWGGTFEQLEAYLAQVS